MATTTTMQEESIPKFLQTLIENNNNDDALRAFQLRYRFQDHKFYGLVWRSLQEAGWTYTQRSEYVSPDNGRRIFPSAAEVSEYLDRFGFLEFQSNLQSSEKQQDDETGRKLREDVLQHMFRLKRDDPEEDAENDVSVADDTKVSSLAAASKSKSSSSRYASITASEKGTDLYLHRKGRKQNKKKNTTTNLNVSTESLDIPSLEECMKLLRERDDDNAHADPVAAYKANNFASWRFLLSTNHSLLFYGAGSKYRLLNDFCEEELSKEGYVIVVDGFDQDADMDELLDMVVDSILDGVEPEPRGRIALQDGDFPVIGKSNPWRAHPLVERAINVSRALAETASESLVPVFLVIHNLDGPSLRNDLTQEALCALVVNSSVESGVHALRLVASVDHVDAMALMWSVSQAANFSWICQEVHTHRPHVRELAMLQDIEIKGSKAKQIKIAEQADAERVEEVLRTLAPRHTEVMHVLAKLQLEERTTTWIERKVFAQQCQANHIVGKTSQLQPLLVELIDHGLITTKAEKDKDLVTIPYDRSKVREILRFSSKNNDAK